MEKTLTINDFLALLDIELDDNQVDKFADFISKKNFRYEIVSGQNRDKIILDIFKRIDSNFSKSGENRKSEWNDGWEENLKEFIARDFDTTTLVPKYYRPSQIKRWQGEFILTQSESFEYDFFDVLRQIVFSSNINSTDVVFEFGCGSPHNLVCLAKMFPQIELHGCDWSLSAVSITDLLREKKGINVNGHLFDFFNPELIETPKTNSIYLTCGGLEQVGSDFQAFVRFVLEKRPSKVIHLEPISELYDDESGNLLDYLAKRYHNSRNYLNGYLTHIRELEIKGLIKIEKIRRVPFGGQFHEGWSLLIWQPTADGLSN